MKRNICLVVLVLSLAISAVAESGGYTNVQQALTTSAQIKHTQGQLYGYEAYNPNGAAVWLEFYNSATAPTIGGTTGLLLEIAIPAGATVVIDRPNGLAFNTGLYVAVATTATGSGAPSTGLTITTVYR